MRLVLKVLSLPLIAALTLAVAALSFLAVLVTAVLKFLSVPAALLGVLVAVISNPVAGLLILAGAFLISPFGLPALANWLLDHMTGLNLALRDFVAS